MSTSRAETKLRELLAEGVANAARCRANHLPSYARWWQGMAERITKALADVGYAASEQYVFKEGEAGGELPLPPAQAQSRVLSTLERRRPVFRAQMGAAIAELAVEQAIDSERKRRIKGARRSADVRIATAAKRKDALQAAAAELQQRNPRLSKSELARRLAQAGLGGKAAIKKFLAEQRKR